MKILILYTHPPSYWLACMRYFVAHYNGEFFVVYKKSVSGLPFDFSDEPGIHFINCLLYTSPSPRD